MRKLVREKLFKTAEENGDNARLIGSKCVRCGEVVFPKMEFCPNCCSNQVAEVLLSAMGKLYSFTVIYQSGPAGYQGPVPYGVAKVEMPEGLRVTGYCTENDPAKLLPGMDMECIVDKLFDDSDGNEIIGFKFKPVYSG
jgi:uncharacterized protein